MVKKVDFRISGRKRACKNLTVAQQTFGHSNGSYTRPVTNLLEIAKLVGQSIVFNKEPYAFTNLILDFTT
ncbi:hypothetical protein [Scytonema sp. HK-05]|uniref:hypothetical protein n=1 Tax=Scytonema sp. HK-05 TaxID=1137095 RepID=UPI0009363699|nr:hypothetical protein [Scytonema sp. HK-05]OKH57427.1 hypothetical protein NIES2130_20100 [Scytonema sp. HK-05]